MLDTWRDEAGDFIYQVWSIARENLPPQEREKRYEECTKKLLTKARELKLRTESLKPLAQSCIEEEESHRRPPPGWDPDDAKANLAIFSDSSARMVKIHLQLLAYGRGHCK